MLVCKIIDSHMEINMNTKLLPNQGELEYDGRYRRLVDKLNYLTMMRLNITFAVSVVSQFLSPPRTTQLEVVMKILRNLKKLHREGFSIQIMDTPESQV